VLLDTMVVEDRPGIAKGRLIVCGLLRQVLHYADNSPGQREAETQQHQQTNGNVHGSHRPFIDVVF
jgi:hypothetical protein